jgi:hypothetical protein
VRYSAQPVLEGLTAFQRRTVDHVVGELYGDPNAERFLVADETGLGKSMVARGVIARAVEHLQDVDSVKRIDIVYVCSNLDLANQNIRRLQVTDDDIIPFASRLTLLGKHSAELTRAAGGHKPVNLVSFTPGTSFDPKSSTGSAQERAMLYLLLEELLDLKRAQRTAALRLLKIGVRSWQRFRDRVDALTHELRDHGVDPAIVTAFSRLAGDRGEIATFQKLVEQTAGRSSVPADLYWANRDAVAALRRSLAEASVATLEPDLVILDEFQRFRHLLSTANPAGELAHHLFDWPDAKVLLLSATPYKPFTYAEEGVEENHERSFLEVLDFLTTGRSDVSTDTVASELREYRDAVVRGNPAGDITKRLQRSLLKVMTRAERPRSEIGGAKEILATGLPVTGADLAGYAHLHRLAQSLRQGRDGALISAQYWKSAPYFATFCEGYRLGVRLREAPAEAVGTFGEVPHVRRQDLEAFERIDAGNARMRHLMEATIDKGWWQLLWVPPSMPYLEPGAPYVDNEGEPVSMTKRLVFSSWTATPSAVASLLSYEVERLAAEDTEERTSNYREYTAAARQRLRLPFSYSVSDGRPSSMATLLLFWPFHGLANAADPLRLVAESSGAPLTRREAWERARPAVARAVGGSPEPPADPAARLEVDGDMRPAIWRAAFARAQAWPALADHAISEVLVPPRKTTDDDEANDAAPSDPVGLAAHIAAAREARAGERAEADPDAVDLLTLVALHAPGNIAWRALGRQLEGADVSDEGHFRAAAVLANGLRSLFNRPDVTKLMERVTDPAPYWRRVLHYTARGNLQAVLDEYIHHLRADQFAAPLTDESLMELAVEAASAVSLRTPTYRALDLADVHGQGLAFTPRFALRYGGRRQDAEDVRQPEVRRAFNSPFWPFVLASTSVGQEGIDFHWWCHAVFHWNTPPNPVDFEQREGRVDRYRGHAVRRNVAEKHAREVLRSPGRDPWATAWNVAEDDEAGFMPSWVYPGSASVERHIVPYPLSSDGPQYERVKESVALYRLTFGQPRQEDMLTLLKDRGVAGASAEALRVRLVP